MNGVRWRPPDVGQAGSGNARVSSGHWSATTVGVATSIVWLPPRGLSRWFWTLALKRSNYWTAGKLSVLAKGDFNADGFTDLAVGAPFEDLPHGLVSP
jgi:hypothetical protein